MTNLGTFRAYVEQYLRSHLMIHQDITIMVRQLDPAPTGLPLEIYCFTADTSWETYEGIQADIFDHLLAILPEFGLRVFQQPSRRGLARVGAAARRPGRESPRGAATPERRAAMTRAGGAPRTLRSSV